MLGDVTDPRNVFTRVVYLDRIVSFCGAGPDDIRFVTSALRCINHHFKECVEEFATEFWSRSVRVACEAVDDAGTVICVSQAILGWSSQRYQAVPWLLRALLVQGRLADMIVRDKFMALPLRVMRRLSYTNDGIEHCSSLSKEGGVSFLDAFVRYQHRLNCGTPIRELGRAIAESNNPELAMLLEKKLRGANNPLGEIARHVGNQHDVIDALLSIGADPNLRNSSTGQLPILAAMTDMNGVADRAVEILLRYGAKPDVRDSAANNNNERTGKTPLAIACESRRLDRLVDLLISYGADPLQHLVPNSPRPGTLLHILALNGSYRSLQILLRAVREKIAAHPAAAEETSNKEDDDDYGDDGDFERKTKLSVATVKQWLLVRYGEASVNCLHCAAQNNHGEVIDELIAFANFVSAHDKTQRSTVTRLLFTGQNSGQNSGRSPLAVAIASKAEAAVDRIAKLTTLTDLVDMSQPDCALQSKETVFHAAAAVVPADLSTRILEALRDIVVRGVATHNDDFTREQRSCKRSLLESESVPNGETALLIASRMKNAKAVALLLSMECDPNNKFPLHAASKLIGNEVVIQLLVQAGARVNQASPSGKTALHFAASFGRDETVKLLLRLGANKALRDVDGHTALDSAKESHTASPELLRLLRCE